LVLRIRVTRISRQFQTLKPQMTAQASPAKVISFLQRMGVLA
jgi:hypothetical protein